MSCISLEKNLNETLQQGVKERNDFLDFVQR